MKKYILLIISILCVEASAQVETMYASYPFNALAVNPAYAGSHDVTSLSLINRRRSIGFQNTYSSPMFSVHTSVGERWGAGFQAFRDPNSVASIGFYASVARKIALRSGNTLSIGGQLGFTQVVRPNNIVGNNAFPLSGGLGAYYYTHSFFAGVSVQNISQKLDFTDRIAPVFITAGKVFELQENIRLKTSALLRVDSDIRPDFNATAWYKHLGVGLWYLDTQRKSSGKAGLLATAEYQVGNSLRIGVGYDLNANAFGSSSFSTAESTVWQFLFRYDFGSGNQMRYF